MQLNVNTDENVILANKLEKLHRSAFPVAVRQALDSAAFDMKKDTLLSSAKKSFQNRHPGNVWRTFSRVNKSKGFDIDKFGSEVGFRDLPRSDFAENQDEQERGGKIDGRSFIPLDEARSGSGQVKKKYRLNRLSSKTFVDAKRVKTRGAKGGGKATLRDRKQPFVTAAITARKQFGNDAFVLSQFESNGSRILYHIKKAKNVGGKLILDYTPIYSVKSGRNVNVDKTNYLQVAGKKSVKKLPKFFQKAGERQIERALKK